jgi:hypothetical protein
VRAEKAEHGKNNGDADEAESPPPLNHGREPLGSASKELPCSVVARYEIVVESHNGSAHWRQQETGKHGGEDGQKKRISVGDNGIGNDRRQYDGRRKDTKAAQRRHSIARCLTRGAALPKPHREIVEQQRGAGKTKGIGQDGAVDDRLATILHQKRGRDQSGKRRRCRNERQRGIAELQPGNGGRERYRHSEMRQIVQALGRRQPPLPENRSYRRRESQSDDRKAGAKQEVQCKLTRTAHGRARLPSAGGRRRRQIHLQDRHLEGIGGFAVLFVLEDDADEFPGHVHLDGIRLPRPLDHADGVEPEEVAQVFLDAPDFAAGHEPLSVGLA